MLYCNLQNFIVDSQTTDCWTAQKPEIIQMPRRLGRPAGSNLTVFFPSSAMTSRFLGVQMAGPLPQFAMKVYPFLVRLYFYAGSTIDDECCPIYNYGGGIGYDIHLRKSRRLILQPQIGRQFIDVVLAGSSVGPSASMSLSYAFGSHPAWLK